MNKAKTFFRTYVSIATIGLFFSCAHQSKNEGAVPTDGSKEVFREGQRVNHSNREIIIRGVNLEHTDFDIPVTVNSQVEKWVDYFTGRGRRYFSVYLNRSKLFIPYITKILAEEKLPHDLVYLAMIESGFHNHARSRAKAVGPWQFISATGKRYGLRIDYWVDDRRDVEKSTLAAGRYLRDLYHMFGNWELAASAYNAGETKVSRAVRRFGTTNYWTIIRHRFLRPETRNYVAKWMAAAMIAKNRNQFGFVENDEPIQSEFEQADKFVVLPDSPTAAEENDESSEVAEADSGKAEEKQDDDSENSETREVASIDDAAETKVPAPEPIENLILHAEVTDAGNQIADDLLLTPLVSRKGELAGALLIQIDVNGPVDLKTIGHAAGLTYSSIRKINPQIKRWCTPPNDKKFTIWLPLTVKEQFLEAYNHPTFPREIQFRKYKVKKGDTLSRIARRFGISIVPIKELNNIQNSRELRRGKWIQVPMPVDRSRSISSLGLKDSPRKRYRKRSKKRRGTRNSSQSVYERKVSKISLLARRKARNSRSPSF